MKMARAFQNGGTIPPFSFSAVNSMIKGGTFRRVVYNPREKQRSAMACLRRAWTFPLLFRRVRLLTPLQATAISW